MGLPFLTSPFLTIVWGRFGIGLGSVWDRFGVGLGSIWGRLGKFEGKIEVSAEIWSGKALSGKVAPYMDTQRVSGAYF